jgi:ATP phosphoribosyltransferase
MLRIAVPNKGSLADAAAAMLHEAGYRLRRDSKQLFVIDEENQVELFYLRPRDIAVYVGSGRLDLGITGRDLLIDSKAEAEEIMELGFAGSTFRFAGKPGGPQQVSEFGGLTIATSYPNVVRRYLAEHGIEASVVRLDGAVETALQLGVAQVIADVVETGASLRNAGLEVVGEPIMHSEAVVIRGIGNGAQGGRAEEQFLRRLQGVLVARSYVLMDYDIRVERVEEAVSLTPGLESPTVSPLHNSGWVAVRSMVPSRDAQKIMDDLYEIEARAILVTKIHACRL